MKEKTKAKLVCKELNTGVGMCEHTLDAIVSPGYYRIECSDVGVEEGFPDELAGTQLSAYLEVTTTNSPGDRLKERAIGQVLTVTDGSGTTNIYSRSRTKSSGVYVWNSWSGVGGKSAGDIMDGAITAQKISSDIRANIVSPLRPLFIAAGAEYNNTGVDITKVAPWGDAVIHKAGHYYLNGLGDITEEQMMHIYVNKEQITKLYLHRSAQANVNIRTIFPLHNRYSPSSLNLTTASTSLFAYCYFLEIIIWSKDSSLSDGDGENKDIVEALLTLGTSASYLFASNSKLRYVFPMNAVKTTSFTNTFQGCKSLIEARLYKIKTDVSFSDSPLISKECILYIIRNAASISAITITLHPDAYNRLYDDTDVVAALENQSLLTLVTT